MIRTIYTALSGMDAYRKGLDAISNNVANLNTPGFKSGVPMFLDIVQRNASGGLLGSAGSSQRGAGVTVDTNIVDFKQGEMRSTGNPLDAAVDGSGFFVLERNGQQYYTRAGQFQFDKDGFLVDRSSGARVAVSTASAGLTDFNVDAMRAFAPKATKLVTVSGNLARTGSAAYELGSITVFDSAGGSHALKAKFVQDGTDPLKWTVEVRDENNVVLGSASVTFNTDGTLNADPALKVTVKPKDLPTFDVGFDFGKAGSYGGITSLVNNTQSQLQMVKQDGVTFGSLTSVDFDEKGQVTLHYSNGEKLTPATLLLAQFGSSDPLVSIGGGLFVAPDATAPIIGTANSHGLGRLVGGQLELSNVDLTEQFTNLIIIQRGYQASSQMATVANEMVQQLLTITQGR